MASETSSVLEMEDADLEALSTEDDPPLMMQPGHDIAVKVDAPMKQLSTLETFVTYRVRCVCARWPPHPPVHRRYNHFKLLHKRLSSRAAHAWVPVPPPPPLHTARQQLDRYSPSFVAVRTRALNAFLDRLVKHPIFTHSEDLKLFLTTPDEDFDKIFKSENSALNLWGLSSALYGASASAESKPTANGARVKDPEWVSHLEYLQSLEQKLTTLCSLTSKMYQGEVSVAQERASLQRVCSVWSAGAGGALGGAAGAVGAGAGGAAHPPPTPLEQRARLPLLAAYTAAMARGVAARQHAHAAYIADPNPTGELHNKVEQASEGLRSELAHWLPTTRAEVKALLLLTAVRQEAHYARTLSAWESARARLDPAPVFETVSRAAAINLSPSKYSNLAEDAQILHGDLSERENSASGGENSVSASRNTENSAFGEDISVSGGKSGASDGKNSASGEEKSVGGGGNSASALENSTSENKNDNLLTDSSRQNGKAILDKVPSDSSSFENVARQSDKIPSESSSIEHINKSSFTNIGDDKERADFTDILDNTNSASLEPSLELPSDPLREFSDVDLS